MQIKEAYSILEIPQTSTPEEAKKKYRELSKKFHPDVNKDPGAESKFKKINEAYTYISSGKGDEESYQSFNPFGQQNPFGRRHQVQVESINLYTTISFKESVFGSKKDLKFKRKGKCENCNGQGQYQLNNGCDKCNGRGQTVTVQGNMMFQQTCDKCRGRVKTETCTSCSNGSIDTDVSINVTIPGGVESGNILRLNGMGNY